MSDPDAYQDEMTTPFGPNDDQLDGIYAGVAPTEQLEDVAAFMLEVKAEFSGSPADEVADRHLAAMAQEARRLQPVRPPENQTVLPAEKNRWRRAMDKMTSLALKGATGVLAASMSMMGLAYAGVDLPGQAAERALESVTGVELPNQEDSDAGSVAEDVKAVVDSDADKGCEFGQAVAAAASQNAQGDRADEERCSEADDGSEAQGSKATGEEKSAAGRAKAAEKSGAAADNATSGTDRASAGADNGAAGSDRTSSGSDNATTGTDRAEGGADNAGEGRSTAEDNAGDDTSDTDAGGTAGPATGDEKSAGVSTGGAANAGARP